MEAKEYLALTAMKGEDTMSSVAVSIRGGLSCRCGGKKVTV